MTPAKRPGNPKGLSKEPSTARAKTSDFKWKKGNCYEDALMFLIEVEPSAVLVHGTGLARTHDGRIVRTGHAWVEVERGQHRYCLDYHTQTGKGPMLLDEYYNLYSARPNEKFSVKDACSRMQKANHYGPWQDTDLEMRPKRSRRRKRW